MGRAWYHLEFPGIPWTHGRALAKFTGECWCLLRDTELNQRLGQGLCGNSPGAGPSERQQGERGGGNGACSAQWVSLNLY